MSRLSLFSRSQRTGGIAIHSLIMRAERAAEAVCRDYSTYVLLELQKVRRILSNHSEVEAHIDGRATLLQAARDLQSSAAMAGHSWVDAYAKSLVNALVVKETFDPALPIILNLHLDAIKVAAQGKSSTTELEYLGEKLGRAVGVLKGENIESAQIADLRDIEHL